MKVWRVFITPAAERAVKTLPPDVQNFVFEEFPRKMKTDPLIGESLSGPLTWLRSFHFSVGGKPYRVAYSVDSKNRSIHIHYAGHRSNFYQRLRRHLR